MNDQILTELEHELKEAEPVRLTPFPVDRWLGCGILQKAIRRGAVDVAQRAILTLWNMDKRSMWGRLHIISTEDIGVANLDAVTKTLTALSATGWRTKTGDLAVALHLTKLLCLANKSRLADEVYTIAARATDYADLRCSLLKAKDDALANLALDDRKPLVERCLGLWLLAGTRRYPHEMLPPRTGNLEAASEVLRSLDAPVNLKESCIACLKKSVWPLVLMTPLLAAEMEKQRTSFTLIAKDWPMDEEQAIPLPALDMFTRIGRACFAELKKATPDLQPFLTQQIAVSMFYLEGFRLDKRLSSPVLDECRRAGAAADIVATGLTADSFAKLKKILMDNASKLEAIRRRQITSYFNQPASVTA